MKKILYCWEMGGGLGHLVPMSFIANELKQRGYRIICAIKDLDNAYRVLSPFNLEWISTPKVSPQYNRKYSINHAELLMGYGYNTQERLYTLCTSWQTIFSMYSPDAIICDYAPTASFVARQLKIPVVHIDSGFSTPPLQYPLPSIIPNAAVHIGTLINIENKALQIINTVSRKLDWPTWDKFYQMYEVPCLYRNHVSLNPFGYHSPNTHLGPIESKAYGISPRWPSGDGPLAFAYLRPDNRLSMPALIAIINYGFRVCAYLPNFNESDIGILLSTKRIMISKEPVDLDQLNGVELGVWHSANGSAIRSMEKNMRMIFLPSHTEQELFANAVVNLGVPAVSLKTLPECWDVLISSLLETSASNLVDTKFHSCTPSVFADSLIELL